MRTCSYLFLMPILSQEGNGDVTNLAVRDDAVTKPVQRVARHRTRTMQVPMHFTFTIARWVALFGRCFRSDSRLHHATHRISAAWFSPGQLGF